MENNDKGISVIIPVYNREKYIQYAIDSILSQKYNAPLEIIISDDGSTDKSLDIVRSYNNSQIVILEKPKDCKQQGAAPARNRGLKNAKYPLVCFLDSDDFQLDGFLINMSSALIENPMLHFVICRTKEEIIKQGTSTIKEWTKKRVSNYDINYLGLTRSNIINTNCIMFRRSVFTNIMFNENLKNGEDSDLWLRIGEQFKGQFVDFYGTVRRSHEDDQLTKNPKEETNYIANLIYTSALERSIANKDEFRVFLLKVQQNIGINRNKWKKKFEKISLIIKHPIYGLKFIYIKLLDFFE